MGVSARLARRGKVHGAHLFFFFQSGEKNKDRKGDEKKRRTEKDGERHP